MDAERNRRCASFISTLCPAAWHGQPVLDPSEHEENRIAALQAMAAQMGEGGAARARKTAEATRDAGPEQ